MTLICNGTHRFRWVVCQLDALQKCLKVTQLRSALRSLPKTLDDTYSRILLGIDEEYIPDALKILQWMAYSRRPMRLSEVAEVISIDLESDTRFDPERRLPEPRDILVICSSLLTISTATINGTEDVEELRFAHFSVKEYLVSQRILLSPAAKFSIVEIQAHLSIAQSCLAYLLSFNLPESMTDGTIQQYPLARYAAEYWTRHVLALGQEACISVMDELTLELFLHEGHCFLTWIRLWNPDEPMSESTLSKERTAIASNLYYASTCGLSRVVQLLLDTGVDVNAEGGDYGNALQAASANGHLEIVRILLDRGANVNAKGGRYSHVLHAASYNGCDQVVQLLVDQGCDIEAKDNYNRTALSRGAEGGHMTVAKLLIEHGAQIEARDSDGQTPLLRAAEGGYEAVVKLLVGRGANAEARDKNGQTPLSRAAKKGREGVVRLLIVMGAEVDSKDARGHTALTWAAKRGHEDIVTLLLEKGADINVEDVQGQTALFWARKRGNEHVVKLLLAKGAEVETKDMWWGASVIGPGGHGITMQGTLAEGYDKIIGLLLDRGVDMEKRGSNGQTALLWAAEGGHEMAVQLLVDRGADCEARDANGQTVLLCAAKRGHCAVVELLVDKGANMETKDTWWNQTPLSWAAKRGHEAVVRLLVQKGTDIDAKDNEGQTALLWAAKRGYEGIVKFLIENGADATAKSTNGQTALSCAMKVGHTAVAQLLHSRLKTGNGATS